MIACNQTQCRFGAFTAFNWLSIRINAFRSILKTRHTKETTLHTADLFGLLQVRACKCHERPEWKSSQPRWKSTQLMTQMPFSLASLQFTRWIAAFFPTNLSCLFNVIVAFCWEHARKKHIMRLLRLDMWNRIQQLNQQEKQIANIIKYEVKRDSIVGWLKRGSR